MNHINDIIMARHFILSALLLSFALNAAAQDDDMYFTPKKSSTPRTTERTQRSEVTSPYDYEEGVEVGGDTYSYSGSIRDVDEYNRRKRPSDTYSYSGEEYNTQQDSILVSREDYENSMKMKRFDGYNNITLVVNDPWYYDPWYYDSFYWGTRWYAPWHYTYYDPWHYSWGWYGYWGGYHNWGWGYTWHHHAPHRPLWSGGRPRPTISSTIPTRRNTRPSISRSGNYGTSLNRTRNTRKVFTNTRNTTTSNNYNTNTTSTRQYNSSSTTRSSFSSSGSRSSFSGGGGRPSSGSSGGGGRIGRR